MDMPNIQDSRLAIALISLVGGIVLNQLASSVRGKTKALGYFTYFNRIGLSVDDQIFGSIRLNWQGHELRNLYSYSIEIENLTLLDIEDFEFQIFTNNETVLLNQKTEIVDTAFIVYWSPKFQKEMEVPEGGQATDAQIDAYHRCREFNVPVFNRGQRIRLTFLCTRPEDDNDPFIGIGSQTRGVRLKRLKNPYVLLKPIFGVPIPIAITRALVVSLLTVGICAWLVEKPWIASAISITVGMTGQLLGALLYKAERFIKDGIAG